MTFELLLLLAILLDLIIGDPRWFPHPVRLIGKLCVFWEKTARILFKNERTAGIFTVFMVLAVAVSAVSLIFVIVAKIHPYLETFMAVLLLYFLIAVKDLLKHSNQVYKYLEPDENLTNARIELSKIVGRDTEKLSKDGVVRACIETVAENMVDGITAPLFWAVVFSLFAPLTSASAIVLAATGMLIYKTVNTMDSMFGYKNDQYINFGWAPAKVDDLFNFLPSRLSGLSVIAGTFLCRKNWRGCFKVFVRDRCNHSSPNAGHTEAAIAGALDIQLGGNSFYFGKVVEKPTLGDNLKSLTPSNIVDTHIIVAFSSSIFLLAILFLRRIIL